MKNKWGFEYEARKVVGCNLSEVGYMYTHKSTAITHAKNAGGDWAIIRIWPWGWEQKIATVGGYFDDWPDYDEREDY